MNKNNKGTLKIVVIVFSAILFYNILQNSGMVSGWISYIADLLSPIFIGALLAFVINIPLNFFETVAFAPLTKKRNKVWLKIHRPVCLLLSVLLLLSIISLVVVLILPAIRDTAVSLVKALPDRAVAVVNTVEVWLDKLNISFSLKEMVSGINWSAISSDLLSGLSVTGNTVISLTSGIVGGIFNLVIGFALSLYILGSKEKLGRQFERLARAFLPKKFCTRALKLFRLAGSTFTKFITGQLTEAVLISVFCYIGMLIFQMPYAVMVSALIGVTALIPVFGAFIGTALGALLILFVSPLKAIGFVVFIIVLQQIDNNVVYPRVVGTSIGLPGLWVLSAVTIGGSLAGPAGMFLGVPVCAVIYCIVREYVLKKEESLAKAKASTGPGDTDGSDGSDGGDDTADGTSR